MALIIGTNNGICRHSQNENSPVEKVLDCGDTLNVNATETGVFAATKTGLYRSQDGGKAWNYIETPRHEVYSFAVSPDGNRWYMGTHPAHIYTSGDEGKTWRERDEFQQLPSRSEWGTPRHRGSAHVRSLDVHPDSPGLVVAGVEVGGVHVSNDYGETWEERREGIPDDRRDRLQFDVHDVRVIQENEFVISCGGGVYHTRDSGVSWNRLNPDENRPYATASCYDDGTLYLSLQSLPPTLPFGDQRSGANGALWSTDDMGRSFKRERYPDEPDDYISGWAVRDNDVFASSTMGRITVRKIDGWETFAEVPEWIRSMTWA